MRDEFAPFTIHEAEVVVYLQTAAGDPADEVAFSGHVEGLRLREEFKSRRIEEHGSAHARLRVIDEEHSIEISQWWAVLRSTRKLPRLRRDQRYVMVFRFVDERTGGWALITFYGVQMDSREQQAPDEGFMQDLRLLATMRIEESGHTDPPPLEAASLAVVRYVDGEDVVDLYTYSFSTNEFKVIDPDLLVGRAEIVSDSEKWELRFDGVAKLRVTSTQMLVKKITAMGGSFPIDGGPRVEFWKGAVRFGSVTATGELAVPAIVEAEENPLIPDFEFRVNDAYRGGIGQGVAHFLGTLTDSLT